MRKKLIFVECILVAALILCINLSKGFYPFEKLSSSDLQKIVISYDGNEYTPDSDSVSLFVDILNGLCVKQTIFHESKLIATLTLYSLDETTYELRVFENNIELNGSAYWCSSQYLKELSENIMNLT